MKSNKQLLIISIILLSCLVVGTSFAWWTTSKKQQGNNLFTSACLSISYENETGSVSLSKAYPITDIEGQQQEGYSFTIKNNCEEKVSYIVNLDVFSEDVSIAEEGINVGFDNYVARTLDNYADTDKFSETASYAKNIYSGVLQGKGEYTHNIKMWIDVNVGNEAQNAEFRSQIFVTAGPNINALDFASDECFITEGDTLIKYNNYLCGDSVKVPQIINGVEITKIKEYAFSDVNVLVNVDWENDNTTFIVLDEENFDVISELLAASYNYGCIWTTNYTVTKASEVTDWSKFSLDYLFSGSLYGESTYLQIPTLYNLEENDDYFDWATWDITNTLGYYVGYTGEFVPRLEFVDLSHLKNLKKIESFSISHCKNINEVELPEGLLTITSSAFHESELSNIYFPTTLSMIGSQAFSGNNLSKLEFNSNVDIKTIAFNKNNITELIINNTIIVGMNAFANNTNLTADNIHIGYFSNNTIEDFITTTSELSE